MWPFVAGFVPVYRLVDRERALGGAYVHMTLILVLTT